ncbi:putative acyl-activating enzyme 19 isoform X2 [Telopea speciosissima]|uniref:putative acyl-activating enzyme 19 isoform X2 n=1 Tax=Telopea speciosissima TaxID=54955 RepID=UPI001CC3E80F|nr:putative acyl-activating enzyme 19 isoform X2 [Telopea speciosissima]
MVKMTGDQLTEFQNVDSTPKILGIYMVPSVEYIIAVLSVLRCGEAFLPLDPSWPKERISSIVSMSNVGFVIKGTSSLDTNNHDHCDKSDWLVDQSCCSILCISMKGNLRDQFDQLHLGWPCESKNPRTFCYLMYTSGSTGKPKGVCGTEQGLVNRFLWMKELFPLDREEILLFKTSVSFIDHLQEFLSAILTGAPLVVPPFEELKTNPFCIIDFLKVYCVSRLTIVPSLIRLILPAIESPQDMRIQRSLKLLVLSGEILPISLYNMLRKLLPETSILNLYGSTEVSGDCTYFDCKRLSMVLETEELSTVPIGIPISNCDVVLVGKPNASSEGEIYVGGHCISIGYFCNPTITSLDYVKLPEETVCNCSPFKNSATQIYFRTGDFAKQLPSGDLVYLGRKDRTIKVNGQRVALEEIENTLREHPNVIDAAVIYHKDAGKPTYLVAYIVLEKKAEDREGLRSSIGSWLTKKLATVMIPSRYLCIDSLPLLSNGKINYAFMEELSLSPRQAQNDIGASECDLDPLQVIKKAFCNTLMVEKVADDDDFFMMGGNSITAAQVAYKLGIDMRLLYIFPSASKLRNVLEKEGSYKDNFNIFADWVVRPKLDEGKMLRLSDSVDTNLYKSKSLTILSERSDNLPDSSKYLKTDSSLYTNSASLLPQNIQPLFSSFNLSRAYSFSRSNKVICKGDYEINDVDPCWSVEIHRNRKGSMRELWKVHLESCVDASPLVVFTEGQTYLFIGSHSQIFLCVNAISGFVQWQVKLEGRIECSAAITSDFSQVVVGCYKGKIYFLDFMTGNISWAFQTGGEVKSQPVVDKCRNLIWCGSHDHNLYALDYKNHCCVYKTSCGGSVYGSPSIDLVRYMLYAASTSGRVTAISIKALPFSIVWQYELGVPVFGSLSISSPSGNVICCLVDGHVIALNPSGSIIWTEGGHLLWQYDVGEPITSSAYVDENMQLSDPSHLADRLACICGSSGSIYLLRINSNAATYGNQPAKELVDPMVQEFTHMNLLGDIFSSPVMIGGQIYVGCRDDYVHCIGVEAKVSAKNDG